MLIHRQTASLPKSLQYIFLAFGATLYLYPFMRFLSTGGDEGTLINGAVRVTEGQVPFRDFFEVMGPGTFYWLAGFFKLFGTNLLATRIALMLTTVIMTLLIYFLSTRLIGRFGLLPAVFVVATAFPPWPAISHHSLSNLFALFSLIAWILGVERRQPVLLFMTGLLAGLTTCVMQPKGCLLLMSFLVLFWLHRRQETAFVLSVGPLFAGYSIVAVAVLLYFWAVRALPDLVYANAVWPFTNYTKINAVPYGLGLSGYWNLWMESISSSISPIVGPCIASLLIIPFLAIAALPLLLVLFAMRNKSLAFTQDRLPYWLTGTAVWLSEIHRKDITHLVYGSPILILLCFHLYGRVQSRFNLVAFRVIAACSIFLMAFNWFVVEAAQTKTVTRRGTLHTFGADGTLEFLNAHVAPGEEIFVYPYRPMYYFLAAAKNPTRYSILMYQMNTDSQLREVVRSLEEHKVRYVLWDTAFERDKVKTWFPEYRPPLPQDLVIEPYLLQHYRMLENNDDWRILERDDAWGSPK